jgi:hypothetical protein
VLKRNSLCSTDVSDGNTGFAVDPPQSRSWPSGAAQRGGARAELDDNFRHEVGGLKADAVARVPHPNFPDYPLTPRRPYTF